MRARAVLVVLAALAGAGTAMLPALADAGSPPNSASFTAIDYAWQVSGTGDSQATIAQGGTVTFSYPTGASKHNADFGTGPQPTSCTQTAGPSSGSTPPVPHTFTGPGWSGSCRFDVPGTYAFHCDLHPFMTATIVVQAATTTTGTGTTTTQATTTSTTAPTITTPPTTTSSPTASTPSATPGPSPPAAGASRPLLAGPSHRAVRVAPRQRGPIVRGTIAIGPGGVGGRLEVTLRAARSALAAAGSHRRTVRVGRRVIPHLRRGVLHFALSLTSAGRRALREHGRLAVVVSLTVQRRHRAAILVRRTVTLHSG